MTQPAGGTSRTRSQREKGPSVAVANETGKRYACQTCGAEVIVTKGGNGEVHCCSAPMARKQ